MNTPSAKAILSLPLGHVPEGLILDSVHPNEAINQAFADWESPLAAPGIWRMPSLMEVVTLPQGEKALRFNIQYRDPTGESRGTIAMRYDRALVTKETVPADVTISATVTMENPITTFTDDNNVLVHPWVGVMGRLQDVRHYYFFCLQFPDAAMLYLRDDDLWVPLAKFAMPVYCGDAHELDLVMRDSRLEGWVDGQRVLAATNHQYKGGKAGLRANCTSRVTSCVIAATEKAISRHQAAVAAAREEVEQLAAALPKPVLAKSFDLRPLGAVAEVRFADFVGAGGSPQMLIALRNKEGATHLVQTLGGEIVWKARLPGLSDFILTEPRPDGHCDLFGVSDEEILLVDGRDGQVLARRPLPTAPGMSRLTWGFLPPSTVNLSGGPRANQFLLRDRWPEMGNDGENLWALNESLDILWHFKPSIRFGHGNSIGACDINGDGREEVLAGATLLSADGEVIWRQDEVGEMLKCLGGSHVDALAFGYLAGPGERPVAHLQCGSAGVIVLDALSSEIIAMHAQGHAQGRYGGRFVPDEPGVQILVGCRWGNYGILSIYSGDGRRLSTFQPDYKSQGGPALNWCGNGVELAAIAVDPQRAGAYDHLGRRLLDLRPFLPSGSGIYIGAQCICQDILGDPRDEIILQAAGIVNIITQESSLAPGTAVYTPYRRWNISYPAWGQV